MFTLFYVHIEPSFVECTIFNVHQTILFMQLNQACAGQRLVWDWFLEITFVRDMSIHLCVHLQKHPCEWTLYDQF